MYQPPVSKYQPIWNQLKAEGVCRIVAPPQLHKRIKKAVIKRKDEDLGYKLLCSESHFTSKLIIKIEGNTITFSLKTIPIWGSIGAY